MYNIIGIFFFGGIMKEIKIEDFKENPFTMIGKDWMLITAEKDGKANTMTASWGGLGVIWGKNVASVYIRYSRYTKEFVDGADSFSICVLPKKYAKELSYCGTVSGRDEDKIKKCAFTLNHENNVPYFEEAKVTLICKKLFKQELTSEAFELKEKDSILNSFYSDKDWHVMYIAEIEKIFVED